MGYVGQAPAAGSVTTSDITDGTISLTDYKSIDNEHDEQEHSLMGKKVPKRFNKNFT